MISIESKKFLYDQLKEICRASLDKEIVMPEEEFYSLADRELIEYVFKYRDRQKIYAKGKRIRAYIEMPDCDLEGCNLEGIELSRFVPGIIENGQIRKSKINLKNTKAIINISTVFHNEEIITEDGCECITDFSECDFRGCRIYGRTQEEIKKYSKDERIQYRVRGIDRLDELYLKRRKLHKLSKSERELSDQIYTRLINRMSLGFSLQKSQEVDLTDYDFSGLTEKEIEIILKNIEGYKINISFTGINPNNLGKETRYSQLMSLKDAQRIKDFKYIQDFIDTYPDRNFVAKFVESEYKNGRRSYSDLKKYRVSNEALKKHADYEYKKNPEGFKKEDYRYLTRETFSAIMLKNLRQGNYDEILMMAKFIPTDLTDSIIKEALELTDTSFLSEFLKVCSSKISTYCLIEIYRKKGFDIIPYECRSKELYSQLILNEYRNGNVECVVKNSKFLDIAELIPQNRINEIAREFLNKDNMEGLEIFWKFIPILLQKQIVKELEAKGNFEFSNKIAFNGCPEDLLERGLVSRKELEKYIRTSWANGTSGRLLFNTLMNYPNDVFLIKKLILMGEDVNYSRIEEQNRIISIIELAMTMRSQYKREDVLYELLRANVNTKVNIQMKVKSPKSKKNVRTNIYRGPCENAPEFKYLVSSSEFVERFLSEEIYLDLAKIDELKKFLAKNNKMLEDKNLFELNFRTIIFDYFFVTKKIFTENPEVLLKPLELLYAQIMFFRDIGVEVKNMNFMETVGLDTKEFVKKYGLIVAKGYNGESEDLENVVNQMLVGMYPMPSNVMQFKKSIEGDKKMILVNEDRRNGDLLRVYENGNVLEFTDGKVLPIEQRELLIEMLKSGYKAKTMEIDSEIERAQRESAANEILKKLQDPRLKEKAKIYTAYSDGGAQTAKDGNDKTQIENKNAKVKYLVIDINGVTILEPFGQKNNATFMSLHDDELEEKVTKFGRSSALENGFYKIIHEGNNIEAYNYSSNHLVRILDMVIEDKDRMFKVLGSVKNDGRKFCNLLTLEAKYGAVRLAEEYGLSKDEILSAGIDENVREGVEIDEK